MTDDELIAVAKQELRSIDRRRLFSVALSVETTTGSGASASDVQWSSFAWTLLREALGEWLDGLAPCSVATHRWPITENLRLCFVAEPRRASRARGYRRMPGVGIVDPHPLPPLQFEDGDTASLESLSVEVVRDLAVGHRRLAFELVRDRAAWTMLYELMTALGKSNTSEMSNLDLEATAASLGLGEDISGGLRSFDEGWRAVEGLDVPMFDNPCQGDA